MSFDSPSSVLTGYHKCWQVYIKSYGSSCQW